MRKSRYLGPARLLLAFSALAAGCTASPVENGDALTPTELRYRLDARYAVFYCDPDYWPVVRGDEQQRAEEQFPVIAADQERFAAILQHLRIALGVPFSAEQKLAIYRENKRLNSIVLEPDDGDFSFQLRAERQDRYFLISGVITPTGRVADERWAPGTDMCPICLSGDTRIATGRGAVPVAALRAGDLVWSLDARGRRVLVPVLRTARVPLRGPAPLLRLHLHGGAVLVVSGGHPTTTGRTLGDVRTGDRLGGMLVDSIRLRYLQLDATYDLLPASATGSYWAGGALLASTLR